MYSFHVDISVSLPTMKSHLAENFTIFDIVTMAELVIILLSSVACRCGEFEYRKCLFLLLLSQFKPGLRPD
jgi:hypothetical protein